MSHRLGDVKQVLSQVRAGHTKVCSVSHDKSTKAPLREWARSYEGAETEKR